MSDEKYLDTLVDNDERIIKLLQTKLNTALDALKIIKKMDDDILYTQDECYHQLADINTIVNKAIKKIEGEGL
jgi:spore coat polysaccharide biosynthesis predicted glycosyltransferase SpsG